MKTKNNIPSVSNDPLNSIFRTYGGHQAHLGNNYILDFDLGNDQELLMHYMYGAAGPFIDLLNYVDLGVGWTLNPVDFASESEGLEAVEIIENELYDMDFHTTMIQFATYYLTIGRACIIKTYTLDGTFYQNEHEGITGLDCINPLTLNTESIQDAITDPTGNKPFIQQNSDGKEIIFEQSRVIFRTHNNLTRRSTWGASPLQRCITDLRLINNFSRYREGLARKYGNLYRMVTIDPQRLREGAGAAGDAIFKDAASMQQYLDDTANYFNEQERKGGTVACYDWLNLTEASFSGRDVNLNELEVQTLRNIAFKLDVPLDLLMYAQIVNRSVLEVLSEVFIGKRENGPRKHVYTPLIEEIANEILKQHDMNNGYVCVDFNPFLAKNLVEAAQIVGSLWPTGAITRPEARLQAGLPVET